MDCYNNREHVSATTIFDIDMIPEVAKWRWRTVEKGKTVKSLYIVTTDKNHLAYEPIVIYLHRLIMNAQKGQEIDHINGNSLDNRRQNLRLATRTQQCMNTCLRSDNSLGVRGVILDKRFDTYRFEIQKDNIRYYFKPYPTLVEAAFARKVAQEILFGEFARPNDDMEERFSNELSEHQREEIAEYVSTKIKEQLV